MHETETVINTLRKARSVTQVISDALVQLRSSIDDLKERREDIAKLAVSREVAAERARKWAEAQVLKARQETQRPGFFSLSPDRWKAAYHPIHDFGSTALAYLGDDFVENVVREVIEAYGEDEGVSDERRCAMLAELDEQILDAELAEEALIRHGEGQGFTIDRREDADPRAVLAHESALP